MEKLCLVLVFGILCGRVLSQSANNIRLAQTAEYQDCIRRCPVTSEHNPVCGSDFTTYDNPGRLICAQNCGLGITQLRTSRCPATTAATPTS